MSTCTDGSQPSGDSATEFISYYEAVAGLGYPCLTLIAGSQ